MGGGSHSVSSRKLAFRWWHYGSHQGGLSKPPHHCKSISPSFIKSTIRKFVIKEQRDLDGSFSGFAFFLPPKEDFFSYVYDKVSQSGKCAASMAAENCWRKKYWGSILWQTLDPLIFCTKCNFLPSIEDGNFPAATTRPLGPRLSAIFTFFLIKEEQQKAPKGRKDYRRG